MNVLDVVLEKCLSRLAMKRARELAQIQSVAFKLREMKCEVKRDLRREMKCDLKCEVECG